MCVQPGLDELLIGRYNADLCLPMDRLMSDYEVTLVNDNSMYQVEFPAV